MGGYEEDSSDNEVVSDDSDLEEEDEARWDDPEWRREKRASDKAMKAQVVELRRKVETQQKILGHKQGVEMELKKFKYKAQELEAAKETIEELKRKLQASHGDRDSARARAKDMQNQLKEAEQGLANLKSENEGLKKTIAKREKEFEWEKMFRSGLEKARDKLQNQVNQLSVEVKQQQKYTAAADEKFQAEAKDVARERAQRLIDVHKIKLAQNERDEYRRIAREKVHIADVAVKNEAYMKAVVEPLRLSLKRCEQLAKDDAITIAEKEDAIVKLNASLLSMENQLGVNEVETRILTKRVDHLAATLSKLRAEVFRMIKVHPELAVYMTDDGWGPLIKQMQIRGGARSGGEKTDAPQAGGGAELKHSKLESDDSLARQAAWKFALLMEECAEQLEAKKRHQTLEDRFSSARHADSDASGDNSCPIDRSRSPRVEGKRLRPLKDAPVPAPGSLYIGHGLGLRKNENNIATGRRETEPTREGKQDPSAVQPLLSVESKDSELSER